MYIGLAKCVYKYTCLSHKIKAVFPVNYESCLHIINIAKSFLHKFCHLQCATLYLSV